MSNFQEAPDFEKTVSSTRLKALSPFRKYQTLIQYMS